jgi:hypothetical protein
VTLAASSSVIHTGTPTGMPSSGMRQNTVDPSRSSARR